MYFDILTTVANWTLKSNVVLFEKVYKNVPLSVISHICLSDMVQPEQSCHTFSRPSGIYNTRLQARNQKASRKKVNFTFFSLFILLQRKNTGTNFSEGYQKLTKMKYF